MEESDLMKELEKDIDKEIEKFGENFAEQSSEYQLFELGRLDGLQKIQSWIWSLNEFGYISDEKIREKRENDVESKKEIIDYYKNNKEMIENIKKHGEKVPKLYALTIEKVAKEYMEKQKENTELGWKEELEKQKSSDTDKKYCPRCGEEIRPDDNYCMQCGERL